MSAVMPEGEEIRKAIKWVSQQKQEQPERKVFDLVLEAITRFDLSPKDSDFLLNFYRGQKSG